MNKKDKENKASKQMIVLWLLAIAVNIKSAFTDFGTDQAYAVTMSYRHLMGDSLFGEMCEPHQTSAFVTDIFLSIYKLLVPSVEGAVLFLQLVSILLYAGIAWVLYKTIKSKVPYHLAHYMCIIFFVLRPKQSVFPEFSNMLIGFSVLTAVYLIKFLDKQDKTKNLIFAALFYCLGVLSYPTFLVCVVAIIVLLYQLSINKWKSILTFATTCLVCGGAYVGYFVVKKGLFGFVDHLLFLVSADSTHGGAFEIVDYVKGFAVSMIWILFTFVIAKVLERICKGRYLTEDIFAIALLVTHVCMLFIQKKIGIEWSYAYNAIQLLIVCMGVRGVKLLPKSQQHIYYVGMTMSCCSVLAVICLTNLSFLSVLGYFILGTMVSVLPIHAKIQEKESRKKEVSFFWTSILMLFILQRLFVVCGYANETGAKLIYDLENYIRVGPAKGVIATLEKCNEVRGTKEDWDRLADNDTVLAVVPWMLDPLVYICETAEISAYSTINTVTYDEKLLEYWEMYPNKRPSAIAIKCWNGQMDVGSNTWILDWVNENYTEYEDGQYWRFYR